MIRRYLAFLTAALLLLPPVSCFAASSGASDSMYALQIEGTQVKSGAIAKNGDLYLELNPVCKTAGYTVIRTADDSIITMQNGYDTIRIDTTNNQIDAGGHQINVAAESPEGTLGGGCLVSDGNLYLQSDLAAPLFGLDVRRSGNIVSVSRILQNMISVQTKLSNLSEGLLTATIQVPILSGNSRYCRQINEVFQSEADAALAEGRKNAEDLEAYAATMQDSGAPLQCETYFDYSIKYNQNGLFSIVLTDYQYAGGAHGSTVQTSYTFDLNTGKALNLSDLMKPDSGYQKYFDTQVRTQIDARIKSGDLDEIKGSEFKTLGDKPEFYLSASGVVLYFQQYEHFPYAAGIQEFTIPYSTLTAMLSPTRQALASRQNRLA